MAFADLDGASDDSDVAAPKSDDDTDDDSGDYSGEGSSMGG
jgi:hypothetical protein